MNEGRLAGRALLGLIAVSTFLLALNQISDLDAFMHLALGRAISESGQYPGHEPYVYAAEGRPFLYSSWLFSVVWFQLLRVFGPPGPIVAKALLVAATFTLLALALQRRRTLTPLAAVLLVGCAVLWRFRLVDRPEVASFALLAFISYAVDRLRAPRSPSAAWRGPGGRRRWSSGRSGDWCSSAWLAERSSACPRSTSRLHPSVSASIGQRHPKVRWPGSTSRASRAGCSTPSSLAGTWAGATRPGGPPSSIPAETSTSRCSSRGNGPSR